MGSPRIALRLAAHDLAFRAGQYARNTLAAVVEFAPPRVHRPVLARLGKAPTDPSLLHLNDWTIRDPTQVPPVVLVHGTDATTAEFAPLVAELTAAGRRVFALDYGHDEVSIRGRIGRQGLGDVAESVLGLGEFVAQVLAATGADRVDLVGHSQGGLIAHLYVRGVLPGGHPAPVRHVVTLGSSHAGTAPLGRISTMAHRRPLADGLDRWLGASSRQQVTGSAVLVALAALPYEVPGVTWTSIATRTDETIRPPARSLLPPGPGIRNLWVQDLDPTSTVRHRDLPADPVVVRAVLAELDRPVEPSPIHRATPPK